MNAIVDSPRRKSWIARRIPTIEVDVTLGRWVEAGRGGAVCASTGAT